MNQALSVESLAKALEWAEAAVGANWAGPDGPGPALLPRLDARARIALMAEEAGGTEVYAPLLWVPFEAPILWSEFESDVQIAAATLAIRGTREGVTKVREQVQSTATSDKDTLLQRMRIARELSVPMIEGMIAVSDSQEDSQREKLVGLLGFAYGALGWGYGVFDPTHCAELFDHIVKLEAENPNIPDLCNALSFVLPPLIQDGDLDEGDLVEARLRIKVFADIFDRVSGEDSAVWQVNSAGCLADLTQHMSEEDAAQATMKASGRVLEWSATAWTESNAAYAMHQVLEALFRELSNNEAEIDARLLDLLRSYRSKAGEKLRHELAGSLAAAFSRPGVSDTVRDVLLAELCDLLESARDAQTIIGLVSNLPEAGGRHGTECLHQLWNSVRKAPPLVQQLWLAALAETPPESIERDAAEENLRHLLEIRMDANDAGVPLWIGALTSVGVALAARDVVKPLRDGIAKLAADPSCPMGHWLDAAGIAVLGAGQAAPKWLAKILALVEAEAVAERLNPALCAGLSFFLTSAYFEGGPVPTAELTTRLDLLERLTVPDIQDK